MKIEALIIHLARAAQRKPQVERLLAACPVPAHVLDAVDGRAMAQQDIDAVYSRKSLHAPSYPFEITAGEVGCFLSHRKAWQAIVDRGLDAGLIIEDDVEIDVNAFAPALELAKAHVGEMGYIQFQTRPVPGRAAPVASGGAALLVRPRVAPLRTSAQLVSRAQASYLLTLTERFDRPVDGFLQMSWVTSNALCCVVPSGVSDRTQETGGSTISVKPAVSVFSALPGKFMREIRRVCYRRAVRAYSAVQARKNGVHQ